MPNTDVSLASEWRDLLARHARVNAALERELQRDHRLSVTEFEALSRLAEKDGDGCRLQQLVDDIHMSQSALSRLIGRLHDEGLVHRRTCSDDRRGIFACITDEGRERLAQAEVTQADVLARTLHDA
ncbi:MAG: MarR family transcriptional regulator [Solirubrobacteraceae bacterium]|nr:MarR family transcriptional regulator [Solirubrobacteraceae bacterium]